MSPIPQPLEKRGVPREVYSLRQDVGRTQLGMMWVRVHARWWELSDRIEIHSIRMVEGDPQDTLGIAIDSYTINTANHTGGAVDMARDAAEDLLETSYVAMEGLE